VSIYLDNMASAAATGTTAATTTGAMASGSVGNVGFTLDNLYICEGILNQAQREFIKNMN
jgi:hypothetical protein